ncbi:hypothetical protein LXL04_030726 [Taraxacum kok-saghyz]
MVSYHHIIFMIYGPCQLPSHLHIPCTFITLDALLLGVKCIDKTERYVSGLPDGRVYRWRHRRYGRKQRQSLPAANSNGGAIPMFTSAKLYLPLHHKSLPAANSPKSENILRVAYVAQFASANFTYHIDQSNNLDSRNIKNRDIHRLSKKADKAYHCESTLSHGHTMCMLSYLPMSWLHVRLNNQMNWIDVRYVILLTCLLYVTNEIGSVTNNRWMDIVDAKQKVSEARMTTSRPKSKRTAIVLELKILRDFLISISVAETVITYT